MQKRFKLNIKGLVQGVGYRYFCYRKAAEYDITGYVKNLIDGSVETDASGEEGLLNEYIKELKTGPQNSNVTSVKIEELPAENKFTDFRIY